MNRRLQFSLKEFLVAVSVLAAFFGGLHIGTYSERHRFYAAQREVDQIARLIDVRLRWMDQEAKKRGMPIDWSGLPAPVGDRAP